MLEQNLKKSIFCSSYCNFEYRAVFVLHSSSAENPTITSRPMRPKQAESAVQDRGGEKSVKPVGRGTGKEKGIELYPK